MRKTTWALLVIGGLIGCGGEPTPDAKPGMTGDNTAAPAKSDPTPSVAEAPKAADKNEKPTPVIVDNPVIVKISLSKDETDNINNLSDADDRTIATSQKVCPVNWDPASKEDDGHLGAMGPPIKRVVKGKTVFVCCKGCIKDLESDPDKYLAKLSK